jgi:glucose/mannose-6-phosphate isomerase
MLDDKQALIKIDPDNVMGSISMFPDQCQEAWDQASKLKFPDEFKNVDNIIVCGMGGSSFTPKTIKELYFDKIKKPYEVVNGYDLPAYANQNSLIILSSYSGTTEEVLSCLKQAKDLNSKITVVTKGGDLEKYITDSGGVGFIFKASKNPSNQPRVGAGYTLFGHLGILYSLDLIDLDQIEVEEAIKYSKIVGDKMGSDVLTDQNPAKKLALTLKDTYPYLIAAEHFRGFVNGFANQINETAKMISDYRYIPELNHHLMEGLKNPSSLQENALFVLLRSDLYSKNISLRFDITKEVIEAQSIKTHQIFFEGDTKLKQVLEGFTLSGFTTMYMAALYGINPVKIPWVDHFKKKLQELK